MSDHDDTINGAIEAAFDSRSEPATIIRAGVETDIEAMPGRRIVKGENLEGFTTETHKAVWIVPVSSYSFDKVTDPPIPEPPGDDDQFRVTKGGTVYLYDITRPVETEPAFIYMPGGMFLRLNCNLISTNPE
jgi:hypothetical protein